MAVDDVAIRVRLLDAARARADALRVAGGVKQIGHDANFTTAAARRMGTAVSSATTLAGRGLARLAGTAKYGAAGIAGLGLVTAKWGLEFNAQVESSRLRFKLFTDDVDGLTRAVQGIDMSSAFNFGDLSDAAAMLGNSGVEDVPGVLQAAANAAAASGKGLPALQGISIALSQIAAKGRLSQEEINQLNESGAPGAQKAIQKAFGLTKDEVGNLGAQGLSSKKAIRALTEEWTSGRMAKAASDQTKTLGGQWALLTGNLQKASGALTLGLAGGLEHDVLPAANRAASAITKIFGNEGLSNSEKIRRAREVIEREIGPVWEDIKQDLDDADIPEHLGELVGKGTAAMADAAAHAAPHVAKAFLDAWMHSSAGVQLASVAFLANKLSHVRGGTGLLGKGGIGGLFSRAKPVPVYVVNGMPGGPGGTPVGGKTPGKGSRIPGVLKGAGALAVPLGAELALTEFINSRPDRMPRLGELSDEDRANIRGAVQTGRGGTPVPAYQAYDRALARHDAPAPLIANLTLKVNDAVLAKATARVNARTSARRSGGRGPQGLPG